MATRREFIRQTILSSASLALLTSCQQFGSQKKIDVDSNVIKKFRSKLKGPLFMGGDQEYEGARNVASRNPTIDKHPLIIARCTQEEDIARCIDFARQHGLSTAVRSGGHSFLGWGTCDDGLVIDVSMIKDVSVDPIKNTVRAGAGARAKDLVRAAAQYGLAPVMGECGSVGIAGLTLGGGLGWLSGKYGAACDNLLSANLVGVDGRSLEVNANSNADLFWAIRGGGGNFGIATSFEYKLHPVSEVLAGGFSYKLQDAREVLRFYREFMATAPDELQALAYFYPLESGVFHVIVVCLGDLKSAEELIKPFTTIATPMRNTVERRPYADTFKMPPYSEFVATTFSVTKGTYIERLSDEVIDIALNCFAKAPHGGALGFDHYMHGAVSRVAPEATAFNLRAPGGLHVWIGGEWDEPSAALASMNWADETWKLLQPFAGGRIYANYMSVEGVQAVKAAYGSNYARLLSVKKKHDPDNFLRLNQNIRPA